VAASIELGDEMEFRQADRGVRPHRRPDRKQVIFQKCARAERENIFAE